jgi:hypothetical protein
MLSIISAISNLSYGAAITFDPPTTPLSPGSPITSWTESEFIVSGSEFFLHTDSATLDNFYPDNGTAYIRTTFNRPQLTVSNLQGSLFSLVSLDFGEFSTGQASPPSPITIIGHRADGSDISAIMIPDNILDAHGPLDDFQLIQFASGFSNLVSVEIPGGQGSGYSIDNIVVTVVPIPDACLDAWPEDTVETIGGGQSPTNNPKVSQSITGNIVGGAEAYGEKASRIKICAGSFVTIVINDSTGTPTVTELSPGIGCGAGGCSVISLTATEKYKVKSNDGKDTDRITLLPQ